MKTTIITTISVLISFAFSVDTFGQCDNCDISLAKDYLQYNSSIFQQLNVLNIIDKETFEEYKKSDKGSGEGEIGIPGILSLTIGGSNDYEEFRQKRDKLFQLYSYNYSKAEAKDELKIVTNPIAYTEWSKCIKTCWDSQDNISRVYAYITYADSNTILVKVKYKSTATSKNSVFCSITLDNGTVLKESGRGRGYYYGNLAFSLNREDEIGFSIKRSKTNMSTTISISADGADIFREVSKYSSAPANNYANYTVKYTVNEITEKFVDWNHIEKPSPSSHEMKSGNPYGDLYIECFRQLGYSAYKRGGYIAVNNVITLPDLSENQYYKNFTNVECYIDNDGSCGWSKTEGLNQNIVVSPDKRHASVNFTTGSKECTWQWKGEVYETVTRVKNESLTNSIKDNYFVVSVPKNSVGSTLIVTINDNEHLVELGKDDALKKIIFISQTEDGTNKYYSYMIK